MDCLFCHIVDGSVPSDNVFETDRVIAIKDIHPKAPVHILVIPKRHLVSLAQTTESDGELLGELLLTATQIARQNELKGYKVVINTGREGGQVIDHLHVHLLGGKLFEE